MTKNVNKIILLAITIVSLILLYYKNFIWLGSKWLNDPNYSHGPLIPLISIYIGWLKKDTISKIKGRDGSILGITIIFIAIIIQIISIRAQVNLTSSYSFILIIYGIILTYYGKDIAKEFLFPIVYLFFMVPFFGVFFLNRISNMLKLFSAYLSAKIIYSLGIPVFREGVILNFSTGSIEVADPCSGIRSILSLLALGTIFAYFTKISVVKKIILVISAIPLAVLGNLVRILFTGIMTNNGINATKGFIHTLSGLLVFLVALLGLVWLRNILKCKKERIKYINLFALILLANFYIPFLYKPKSSLRTANVLKMFPDKVGEWVATEEIKMDSTKVEALEPSSLVFRKYENKNKDAVWLCIVYHQNDRWRAHDPQVCYKSQGWSLL